MLRTGRAALAALTSSLLLWPLATRAEESEVGVTPAAETEATPAEPGASRILVLIAAAADERDALARVLTELMQRLSVELDVESIERVELGRVTEPIADASPYLARCFIDLSGPGSAVLYVHDPARDRILERRVERGPGGAELVREELGHMLLAAIEGLRAGATLGAPREALIAATPQPQPAAAPAPSRAPTPVRPAAEVRAEPRRDAFQVRGAALYEVAAVGHGPGLTHGPMLAVSLQSPLRLRLGLLLSAQYRFPFEVEADPLGMRMHAVALRALATLESALNARVTLRAAVGAGADVSRLTPETADDAAIRAADPSTLALGVTRVLLGLDVRLSRALSLWAALAADVDLDRTQYVLVRRSGDDAAVTQPWRVRPALQLGVALP